MGGSNGSSCGVTGLNAQELLDPLQSITIASNSDLVLSTQSQTMYMSFHSQANNYLLHKVLDSRLPLHLVGRNFEV